MVRVFRSMKLYVQKEKSMESDGPTTLREWFAEKSSWFERIVGVYFLAVVISKAVVLTEYVSFIEAVLDALRVGHTASFVLALLLIGTEALVGILYLLLRRTFLIDVVALFAAAFDVLFSMLLSIELYEYDMSLGVLSQIVPWQIVLILKLLIINGVFFIAFVSMGEMSGKTILISMLVLAYCTYWLGKESAQFRLEYDATKKMLPAFVQHYFPAAVRRYVLVLLHPEDFSCTPCNDSIAETLQAMQATLSKEEQSAIVVLLKKDSVFSMPWKLERWKAVNGIALPINIVSDSLFIRLKSSKSAIRIYNRSRYEIYRNEFPLSESNINKILRKVQEYTAW